MCLFKKKKLYKIMWKYGSDSADTYTEIIKAYDIADAFGRVTRLYGPIFLESWEEVR